MCSRDCPGNAFWKNDCNPALMIREVRAELTAPLDVEGYFRAQQDATDERLCLLQWILWPERALVRHRFLVNI